MKHLSRCVTTAASHSRACHSLLPAPLTHTWRLQNAKNADHQGRWEFQSQFTNVEVWGASTGPCKPAHANHFYLNQLMKQNISQCKILFLYIWLCPEIKRSHQEKKSYCRDGASLQEHLHICPYWRYLSTLICPAHHYWCCWGFSVPTHMFDSPLCLVKPTLVYDLWDGNVCDGDGYLVVSTTLLEAARWNMKVLHRHDKSIPKVKQQGQKGSKKIKTIHKVCNECLRRPHTADSLAILRWWRLGRVPHVAASPSSRTGTQRSACCDLTHTPWMPNSVNLPSVSAAPRKWLRPACRHTRTRSIQLNTRQRSPINKNNERWLHVTQPPTCCDMENLVNVFGRLLVGAGASLHDDDDSH